MRKYQKSQCIEMIRTLEEAHSEIAKYIEKKEIDTASSLLGECQQAAISLGNTVETTEGEGTEAVSRLEAYCELDYKINEEIVSGENTNPRNVEKRLRKAILSVQSCINALPTKLETVFLPYKASMWDSLESIWMAADEDPNCDAYVIPIPYYDRNPDGSFAQIHYEAVDFPNYVPITHYGAFDLEKHQPDMIFIHNPYDEYNYVTSVHPNFYSYNLKKYTDCLVYVPYYATAGAMSDGQSLCPAYVHADYIVVQSKDIINQFDPQIPKEKFLPLGSPKFDRVIRLCNEKANVPGEWKKRIQNKKVFFFNTSLNGLLDNTQVFLKKMEYVFDTFQQSENAVVIWRPHPLFESTLDSMRAEYRAEYDKIKERFIREDIGIFDTTPDIEITISACDAYLGDGGSSVVSLFGVVGKPIFLLNNNIHTAPSENDWKGLLNVTCDGAGNDRYKLLPGNHIFKRDDEYHYHFLLRIPGPIGGYYGSCLELSGKVFVFPRNAQHILVVEDDRNIRKIELRQEIDVPGAFYGELCKCDDDRYVFLLPDKYPYMVRLDTITEHLDYIDGVSGFNIELTPEGERVRAAVTYDLQSNEMYIFNPQGTQILLIDMQTLHKRIRDIQVNALITWAAALTSDSDVWYLNPYEGTDIIAWDRSKATYDIIHAKVDGMGSIQRPRRYQCNRNYFGSAAIYNGKLILSPSWGNKFVEIDIETYEVREWVPPFRVSLNDMNEYFPNYGIGGFITDARKWLDRKMDSDFRFYYAPERRTYNINLDTKEFSEFPITFDKDEIYDMEQGFCEVSQWMPYCCGESVFNPLSDIIAGNISGHGFDKDMQLKAYGRINASPEGDCGVSVYSHLTRNMT